MYTWERTTKAREKLSSVFNSECSLNAYLSFAFFLFAFISGFVISYYGGEVGTRGGGG